LAGEFLVRALALPLPGPVLGMFLLFGFLMLRGGDRQKVPEGIGAAADGLLGHMSILFVPASVGLMRYFDLLARDGVALLTAVAGSTILAIAVTALTFSLLSRRKTAKGVTKCNSPEGEAQ
jgi:holin-like protein